MADGISSVLGAKRRRLGLVTITLAATASAAVLTGCSSSDDKGASPSKPSALPDASRIVAESARTTQTLHDVHLNLAVADIPNLPVEKVDADVTNKVKGQGQAAGAARVRTSKQADFTDTKFVVSNKTLYAGDGSAYQPVGPAEKVYDPGVILDKDKGIANVIAQIKNPKSEAREKIDGVDTVKISGTVDASVIDFIVPQSGKKGGPLPITVWIKDVPPPSGSAKSSAPGKGSPDKAPNLVKAVVQQGDGTITVMLSKWGTPVSIPNPAA
ncbi:LppX_LprAFG lipoprotein [Streptomyces sp. H51]|uniref:LppX_LprAFG lipoprotein n=1 Tax=Streptomyces sp. H51 TaxID=3111770 RepID=UPI002D767E84|nr:LppX_LprAFG lipoprotein [Streptomyces sp. H51]